MAPQPPVNLDRLPKQLQEKLRPVLNAQRTPGPCLVVGNVYMGDARALLPKVEPNSHASNRTDLAEDSSHESRSARGRTRDDASVRGD